MSLVNYLGTYETLDQVWETYPEGGKEGDYLYIASVLKKWNKYTSAWADATQEDVEGSTIMSLEEDVVVGSSTLINYLGRFETLENAINTYPEGGNEGDYIYVGDDIYAWDKYANGWFVSLDAPLEVAISEEDIIPDSNTFINYLGGFVDRDAVWHKYPEGGKVGDYLYIASDLHIWDKFICNWVAATPPDESSQIRPIEHLSQEGVVEYSENYINYLGVFESIEQAWEAYPEGGKEGDYIIVGGEQLRWNKYTSNWGEYDPDASTPARPVATIYGDLHVHNDVIIGEDLYARILETFTTKKWVLEQGYISMDDVTSELVMSKIVPDNTTIEVRDGKLVVIGGGGGGTADSVAWDNITGKPEWIGDTKPTYTLDEIAGSNGDGFVTLLSDQTIEGVKNFANGAKFNGALLSYDEEKKAWVFPGNIIASGGITAFGSLSTPVASLFEALPIDGTTIKRDPITNELYVDTNVVGGSGGGSLDEEQLEEYLKPYATIEYVSNNYASKTSVDKALSDKANKATTLAGYGITDAYTKSDINATVDSINTSISNLRKYADDTFVTISTPQKITARHNFIDGLKINGLPIYNSQDDVVYIDANLVVRGGVTAWGTNEETAPNIFEGLPIDGTSIYWDNGVLKSSATSSGGINEELLEEYLRPYATQSWVTGKGYITSSALEPYALKTAIPTKLSQLTDDVVSGKYLSIAGGTVNGAVTINHSGNTPLVINQNYGTASNPRGVVVMNSTLSNSNLYISHLFGKEGSMRNSAWVGFYLDSAGSNNNRLSMGLYGVDNVLNILGSGNVAIGGTTASEKLEVHGNVKATSFIGNASSTSKLQNAVSLWGRTFDGSADLTGSLNVTTGEGYRITYNNYDLRFIISGNSSNRGIWDNTNSEWMMYRNSSTNVFFPQGNIGFGTTSPTEKVTVNGNINLSGAYNYKIQGKDVVSIYSTNYFLADSAIELGYNTFVVGRKINFQTSTTTTKTTTATLDGSGNFSITGVLNLPAVDSGFTNPRITFGDSVIRIGATTAGLLGVYASGDIRLNPNSASSANGTMGLWLKTTGYNGINTSNPAAALHVNGKGIFADATNPWVAVQRDGINWYMQVTSGGMRIGRSSALGVLIDASGNLVAPGGVTATNSSDRRLKKNIRKFNASKVLMSLGGVYEYEYIDSEVQKNHIYEGTHYGLIYQNVKGTTLDMMCHEREDGFGTLNYIHQKFISLIAGATMENISEVEELKREIRHLKNTVKQLENRV